MRQWFNITTESKLVKKTERDARRRSLRIGCFVYSMYMRVRVLRSVMFLSVQVGEGFGLDLVHYQSCLLNPGGQGLIRGSAARTEEGRLGARCCKAACCFVML